ncbi:hypothetical protein [Microbacterium halophytorum]|uniref:hypothetical protein n=1 Tax=Microbacterium halophytorum TaxID=2067568 RepID=UPI000CFCFF56|nr:hypothetical protein [Microbacterium halophytorum]
MSAPATGVVAATLLPGQKFAIGVSAAIALAAAILIAAFLRLPSAAAESRGAAPREACPEGRGRPPAGGRS